MQDYDVTLKSLLRGSAGMTLRELTGCVVEKWLDIELPKIQNPKLDLLGQASDGTLLHIELQSTNDGDMALRMAEYCLGVYRQFRKFPRQLLLYVGEPPLSMDTELRGGDDVLIRYRTVDFRELDGDRLLESSEFGDNVIALLARLRDQREALRTILRKMSGFPKGQQETAMAQLILLAGLRRFAKPLLEEARKMPLQIDLGEHEIFCPPYRKGLAEGRQEGRQEGLQEGVQEGLQEGRRQGRQEGLAEGRKEGEYTLLRRMLEKRFGELPVWVEDRLLSRSAAELEEFAERVLDASTLNELFR